MKEKKRFQYACVNCPDVDELNYIVDHAREITYETFRKNVEDEFVREWNKQHHPFTLATDKFIKFYSSKTPDGKKAYFFVWSAIEHVFY